VRDLLADDFADFFRAVHSTEQEQKEPFEWQQRLVRQVLGNGRWPDVIRIPTGCGKTAVLDLALFELALQAYRSPEKRTAPRRVCFVIDRRLVVDEVTEHAGRIRRALQEAESGSGSEVVKAVAARLALLGPEGAPPLRLVRLRGGVYRDDGWAADPLTPTIIISTVDQIGSRLLFRGYGVSRRNLTVHAGLLAFDTRIILDEAHLSSVFADTVEWARRYQTIAGESPLPEDRLLTIIRMSATATEAGRVFQLSDEDWRDHRLKPRLEARKPARLVTVKVEPVTKKLRQQQPREARERERKNRRDLVGEIVRQALHWAGLDGDGVGSDPPRVIGVVVNRVATARSVFEELRKFCAPRQGRVLLLTGRIRPFDRDRLLEEWLPKIRAGREQEPEETLFVVATQTVEVGANIDFDALVTEAAALDALRQRFGRLDRLGRRHQKGVESPASIVIRSDYARDSADDSIYGAAIAKTWEWLSRDVASTTGKGAAKEQVVHFGVAALDPKVPADPEQLRPMLAPSAETPVLFPAHLDAWVQTNPRAEPDPDVAPFLHGRPDTPADILVVWRADLDQEHSDSWPKIVTLMPPLTREALPVPVYEVQAWLRGVAEGDVGDVEGAQSQSGSTPPGAGRERRVLRWRGRDDARVVGPDDLRPGDTIVVPAKYGGADSFGWNARSTDPVEDIAERCLAELVASYPHDAFGRPRVRLRLHPNLFPRPDDSTHQRLQSLLQAAVTATSSETEDPWPATLRLLDVLFPIMGEPRLTAVIGALRRQPCRRIEPYPKDEGIVLSASVPVNLSKQLPAVEREEDEPEGDEASFTGRPVPLEEHLRSVGETARKFADACGLPPALVKTAELAGNWHDQGKRDWRFQAWLRGSELEALAEDGCPLAKSGRDAGRWQPSTVYGYPRGARHEFVSVRLFEQVANKIASGAIPELARFLIGTHHGFGRPFVPVVKDADPVDIGLQLDGDDIKVASDHRLHLLDSCWADLFWQLVRRFGWWGLAYLEALLITADRSVSAQGG